jgi:hypothetical protein
LVNRRSVNCPQPKMRACRWCKYSNEVSFRENIKWGNKSKKFNTIESHWKKLGQKSKKGSKLKILSISTHPSEPLFKVFNPYILSSSKVYLNSNINLLKNLFIWVLVEIELIHCILTQSVWLSIDTYVMNIIQNYIDLKLN